MLSIALTGNIAAGKTSVAKLFQDWGAARFDADQAVHQLQQPGTKVFEAILARFGPEVRAADGTLDRARLRALVLADPAERAALEQIVHPAVQAERRRILTEARSPAGILVSEIPLLFEAADPKDFAAIVLVDAKEATRAARLVQERSLSSEEAGAFIAAQQPAGPKRERATFVIENNGSREALRDSAWGVWRKLVSLARNRA